jgi:hypothetical protein
MSTVTLADARWYAVAKGLALLKSGLSHLAGTAGASGLALEWWSGKAVVPEGCTCGALKSRVARLARSSVLLANTRAAVTPIFMRSAYTVAMGVLGRRLPNPGFDRSAQELRFWVPVALRAPMPGQPERWAAWH